MSCHLHDLVFRQLVPESIHSDSQIAAAADAISPFLQTIVRAVPNLLIYGRLEEQDSAGMLAPLRRLTEARGGLKNLSTEELEQLAWQWHVDFRDAAKTNEKLRAFVLNSVPWHRIKGTPAAMRRALALYGYTAEIEEDGEGENWAATSCDLTLFHLRQTLKKFLSSAPTSNRRVADSGVCMCRSMTFGHFCGLAGWTPHATPAFAAGRKDSGLPILAGNWPTSPGRQMARA